ncbi:MAG: MarR family transcriptional regulator [Clostridium sp.]|jgi:DNA-binding MarR family transcriptional regulator|uniref:HTH-type transcriptional regulator MhqR n=1 Tax=Clostridium coskatii TaxID=1705578 RepID=A0A166T6K1_9CLOT|nr:MULTISPECIES: MarR family transcriptional regulator [Clostridium]MCH3964613.1 MarR family transcriptional regulator [Clostridium sp.]MCH4198574.1 MarR family transcriptional regulator [Clostridium tyrobutyricum]MCH4258891.1 MarR family transcriptional regulator [Clostridium tyrobutyricum]MCI1239761.1 MarR family transcriptional regulator [Clostridium tyrobutyricum]MCI1651457.1 MarR family transcriptional regulator [Clostridium tyrobutyricum]
MNKNIPDIYNLIQELAWHFGNHGFNGECCKDLSLVEFMALKKIQESDTITIQEIGNALNFTKSGASKIINRLEDKGYVIREISSIDGRVCCVNVTTKGIEIIKNIIEEYSIYVDEMLKEFDSDTIENIKSVLKILTIAAQKKEMHKNFNYKQ